MDILLVDKAAEMVGIKSKFADTATGSGGSTKAVWAIISVICLVFAMWHAYNANKCEKQGSKLIMSLVLSFLFPKLSAVYYAMKYKAMPWGKGDLLEKYLKHSVDYDVNKCHVYSGLSRFASSAPPEGYSAREAMKAVDRQQPGFNLADIEGGRGNMFGGWA